MTMLEKSINDKSTGRMTRMFFTILGVIVLAATLLWSVSIFRFVNSAEIAEGTVSQLNAGGSHPEITFTTRDGRSIKSPQGGMIFGYQAGDRVTLYYDPKQPERATLKSVGALWGFPCLAGLLGALFIGIGMLGRTER
jgi:hypothetical protein